MSDWINHGISAQSITAHNLAIGNDNTIEETNWNEPLAQPLADLKASIEAFQGAPQTKQALSTAHAEIAAELSSQAPDKNSLLTKLMSLSALAGPAAGVIQAATALAQVVAAVL
jgi:hypothetical protein